MEPQWIEVDRFSLTLPIPHFGSQKTIALISDLHLKNMGLRERKTLIKLKEISPDLIILAGDVIDDPASLTVLDEFLSDLETPKVIATLGNWEHWSKVNLQALQQIYKKHGAFLLINQCLYQTKLRVNIIGLDDFTAGKPDLKSAALQCDSSLPSVVVEHSPGFFDSEQPSRNLGNFSINMSGHTHSGQVTFVGRPFWTPRGSGDYVSGWYTTPMGRLYVTRGIGNSILPIRLMARPMISVFKLN